LLIHFAFEHFFHSVLEQILQQVLHVLHGLAVF
jgi:glycerol dehydrogenase-like iron-containing ADH family enzyme